MDDADSPFLQHLQASLHCIKKACAIAPVKISTRRWQLEKSYIYQGLAPPLLTTTYIYFQRQISKSPRHISTEDISRCLTFYLKSDLKVRNSFFQADSNWIVKSFSHRVLTQHFLRALHKVTSLVQTDLYRNTRHQDQGMPSSKAKVSIKILRLNIWD